MYWRICLVVAHVMLACARVAAFSRAGSVAGTAAAASNVRRRGQRHRGGALAQARHVISACAPQEQQQQATSSKPGLEQATLRRAMLQPALLQHVERMHVVGRRKLKARQHVNPLASAHQQPVQLAEGWYQQAFTDPTKPLHLDIGCAYGRFCLEMAAAQPEYNHLGLEIRWPVVAVALSKATERELDNCHYVSCNVNVDLANILRDAVSAGASLQRVSIQFPDPHFKNRNKKKRVLKPALVETIQQFLVPGGVLFMQGDIHEVQHEMRSITREAGTQLLDDEPDLDCWLQHNPMGVPTEREVAVQAKGGSVYRCIFRKR